MLNTPFGKLVIQKNGVTIPYKIIPQKLKVMEKSEYYVDARYLILIDTTSIRAGDTIKCLVVCQNIKTDIDGGECLSLLNFSDNNVKMSLGAYDMLDHLYNNKTLAFEVNYIENGLEAYFIDTKYVEKFKLALSWMKLGEGRDDIATWFASDPTLGNE